MRCPLCRGVKTRVLDSRPNDAGIRRRRECGGCRHRFTTIETFDTWDARKAGAARAAGFAAQQEDGDAR